MSSRINRPLSAFLVLGIAVIGVTQPAVSAENSDFMNCGQLFSGEERLVCYDAVYSARIRGVPPPPNEPGSTQSSTYIAPSATSATPAVAEADAEAKFGIPQPADPGIDELRSPVAKVSVNNVKQRLVFHLENGQIWEQAEGRNFYVPDERPLMAVITPGILSSYHLSFEGQKSWVKVKRIK